MCESDSNIIISAVPVTLLDHMFEKAVPHLERVIEKAPNDISLETIKAQLYKGNSMLVVVSDLDEVIAVNILETSTYDTGHKVLFIPITGGDRMEEWLDQFMKVAHAIAQDLGCNELRGMACRKGWLPVLKKLGWYHVHEVIGCKVEPMKKTEVSS